MPSPAAMAVSALDGLSLVHVPGVVEVADAGPVRRLVYRGSAAALSEALGGASIDRPLRATPAGEAAALWLGPDEWLLLCTVDSATALRAKLGAAQAAGTGSLVDISDRNFGLELSGRRTADALASACPLDFDLSAFPVGMCTRTLFGKVEIVLWRVEPDVFRLEAGRSLAPYVTGMIEVSVRGLPAAAA